MRRTGGSGRRTRAGTAVRCRRTAGWPTGNVSYSNVAQLRSGGWSEHGASSTTTDPTTSADSGGMRVPPHPHTGLQTVTWLVSGEVLHRDSLGSRQLVTARSVEPDDSRAGYRPLRGESGSTARRFCTACSYGQRCRTGTVTPVHTSRIFLTCQCSATPGSPLPSSWANSAGRCHRPMYTVR